MLFQLSIDMLCEILMYLNPSILLEYSGRRPGIIWGEDMVIFVAMLSRNYTLSAGFVISNRNIVILLTYRYRTGSDTNYPLHLCLHSHIFGNRCNCAISKIVRFCTSASQPFWIPCNNVNIFRFIHSYVDRSTSCGKKELILSYNR